MKRIGGEIPFYVDRIVSGQSWPDNWLGFSNGRAAMAWLFDQLPLLSTV